MTQMTQKNEFLKRKFIRALKKNVGNVSSATKSVGVSRRTLYRYKAKDNKFSKEWDNAVMLVREELADIAELELRKAVLRGNVRAIIYTLKKMRPSRWKF